MSFETQPTTPEPHPFDSILEGIESDKVKSETLHVSVSGKEMKCDVRWRHDEPGTWNVYVDGKLVTVTKNSEDGFMATDTDDETSHEEVTEPRKQAAITAVENVLNRHTDDGMDT